MRRFSSLVIALSLFAAPLAKAEIWQSAEVLKRGSAAVGGFGQIYFDPSKFMAYGQFLYGIGNDLQLEARMGGGDLDFYAGFFAKARLVSNKAGEVALWSGIHSQGNGYWDLAPIFSHDFGRVEFYFAPYISISLGDRNSGVTLNPGLSFDIKPKLKFYGELAAKVSNIPTSIIGGVRYSF